MACITVEHLTFTYPEQRTPALSDLSFSVEEGEFLTLIGPSGSGKSTLLRLLKPALSPHGTVSGTRLFFGKPIEALEKREQAAQIGFVLQDPESQLVTDKVWHELAFGLESLGLETPVIRRRVAEMAAFFGIEDWFHKDVATLSGGQKQLLNLAAVMVMQPRVLLLDEPTAQLDPIAASDFLNAVSRLHRELGTTVLLSEHRLEEAFVLSDRVLALNGEILAHDTPLAAAQALKNTPLRLSLPTPVRLCSRLTVGEARQWFNALSEPLAPLPMREAPPEETTALAVKNLSFRYEKDGAQVLDNLSCRFAKGQLTAIMGGNGSGKTTLLKLLAGICKPQRGKRTVNGGTIAFLPQEPQMLFAHKTVREELAETAKDNAALGEISRLCKLNSLLERHPFDLSGGEQQRAALAKLLLTQPDILLLDEPTKATDAAFKRELAGILKTLLRGGATVLMVSHDVEFCAEYADRCLLLFDGAMVAEGKPREFFSGNRFYTTAANRIARARLPEAVCCTELLAACGVEEADFPADDDRGEMRPMQSAPSGVKPLPLWRIVSALVLLAGAALLALELFTPLDFTFFVAFSNAALSAFFALCLLAALCCLWRRTPTPMKRPLNRRARLALVLSPLLAASTVLFGVFVLDNKQYLLISLLILAELMLPMALVFESRRPSARELVLLAVFSALAVAGRAAFYAVPNCKPVLTIVILAGISLGAESGFLVGALSMLLSNILFGQGPWTPWQMFAMGLAGFLAGFLYRRGILRRDRISLCIFGALAAIALYGPIMNLSSAFTWYTELSWATIGAYMLSGFPLDVIHGTATVVFLWLFGTPLLEIIDRLRVKYGILS